MAPMVVIGRLKPDPLGHPRNPLAIYLLVMTLITGIGMLTGNTTSRGAEQTMPEIVSITWGGMLVHGSASTLIGMYWPWSVSTGLLLKRAGMFSLMIAATVYSGTLIGYWGLDGAFSAGITFGFAIACAVQFKVINDRIAAIIALSQGVGASG